MEDKFMVIPKILIEDLEYKSLKPIDILLYGLLRDRLDLSKKNNWWDGERKEYFIKFKSTEMARMLHVTEDTALKAKDRLRDHSLIWYTDLPLQNRRGGYKIFVNEIGFKLRKHGTR